MMLLLDGDSKWPTLPFLVVDIPFELSLLTFAATYRYVTDHSERLPITSAGQTTNSTPEPQVEA